MPMNRTTHEAVRRKAAMPYITSEMSAIIQWIEQQLGDENAARSLHFSPTALTMVRHVMMTHGTIITDTTLVMDDLDRQMAQKLGITVKCFIDDPQIIALAEQRRSTRAEVALDYALSLDGSKLIAIGSAPMALNRLLKRYMAEPMNDVIVLAAPTGFASVLQLKERLWDSDLPSIVVRGKRGGASLTSVILNALMAESIREQNL